MKYSGQSLTGLNGYAGDGDGEKSSFYMAQRFRMQNYYNRSRMLKASIAFRDPHFWWVIFDFPNQGYAPKQVCFA